ncbi:MAG: DNA mismatch repair endonuclease MutL [Dethiobacter sp.]|jgi:DNA mismatch repair protein MutL|nr:DNA mismatch repair endonuclease MutL [Dethiobacter sp.]MBS3989717.1 DNA mismatch repair endonuclease MutL [Dethiobacter sp.]
MGKIQMLDDVTANQIAAGEVVERAAAVVKELAENAIDAGASSIVIQVAGGGLESIRVRDDGSGMAAEDVPLALQRHATSKIKTAEDLAVVTSLGFRGEALPSIAAVSRFRLITRQADELVGTEIVVHGGQVIKVGEAGCPSGTEILVEGLFYNTPARLKFCKSEGAENAKIADTVQRLALAWPEISFVLTVNEKNQFVTAGNGNLEDAAAQVLGRQNMRQMIRLDWQGPLVTLSGFTAKPALARANRNLQYFFVNRRPVRSPLLSDALQTAYQTLLPRNRFPAAVFLLTIEPHELDVNVHPAKREIRFSRERDLYRQVLAAVKDALKQTNLGFEAGDFRTSVMRETPSNANLYDLLPVQEAPALNNFLSVLPSDAPVSNFATKTCLQQGRAVSPFPRLRPIGQYLATYLLAQSEAGELYVIDQHAAHERILYEQLKKELSAGSITVQEVIPQTFELDPLAATALMKSLDLFAVLGLTFETFGNNTFILRTIPAFSHRCLNQDDLIEIMAAVRGEAVETTAFFEKILQMMACKAAIKANQLMERREMEALLERLAETDGPFTCPHGRPTVLVFSEQALARNFRRRL